MRKFIRRYRIKKLRRIIQSKKCRFYKQLYFLYVLLKYPDKFSAYNIYNGNKEYRELVWKDIIRPLREMNVIRWYNSIYIDDGEFNIPVDNDREFILTPSLHQTEERDNELKQKTLLKNPIVDFDVASNETWDSPTNQIKTTHLFPSNEFMRYYTSLVNKHPLRFFGQLLKFNPPIIISLIAFTISTLSLIFTFKNYILNLSHYNH